MDIPNDKYYRAPKNKIIAGVCSGVAAATGKSATTVRWLYVIAALLGVPMVAVYLFQWLVYPEKTSTTHPLDPSTRRLEVRG